MTKNYLNRRFTLRETILLIVLVVILFVGLYMGLVYYPLRDRTSELQEKLDAVETQILVEETQGRNYAKWEAYLEELEKNGQKVPMPSYKNNSQQEVLAGCFAGIFNTNKIDSNIRYGTPSAPNEDGILTRTVSFTFTIVGNGEAAWGKVKSVLAELMGTGFRCSMSSFSLSPSAGDLKNDPSIGVSCSITFYELDR